MAPEAVEAEDEEVELVAWYADPLCPETPTPGHTAGYAVMQLLV